MEEDRKSDKKDADSAGINASGNVTIGNVSGQVAIGKNIIQTQFIENTDVEELKKNLHTFQKYVSMLVWCPVNN